MSNDDDKAPRASEGMISERAERAGNARAADAGTPGGVGTGPFEPSTEHLDDQARPPAEIETRVAALTEEVIRDLDEKYVEARIDVDLRATLLELARPLIVAALAKALGG